MPKIRDLLSMLSDLISVGGAVVGVVSIVVVFLATRLDVAVPLWLFLLALAALAACGFVLHRLDLRRRARERQGLLAYLAALDDILLDLRGLLVADSADRVRRLTRLRQLTFTTVADGIHAGRRERVRCAYHVPAQDQAGMLRVKEHLGHSNQVMAMRLVADGGSAAGTAFSTGQTVYLADAENDQRLQQTKEKGGREIGSLLCVPVVDPRSSTPCGVFTVASKRKDAFLAADQEFVGICASLVGIFEAIEEGWDHAHIEAADPGSTVPSPSSEGGGE